jgi:hypothetical protein
MKKMTLFFALALVVSLVFAAGVREDYPLAPLEMESGPIVSETPAQVPAQPPAQAPAEIELEDPSGREVADIGVPGVLQGTLHNEKDEWYLSCDGIMYELHMGIYGHDEPDMFVEGTPAVVSGFIYHHHIAPIVVETPQTSRRFWREDRFPMWSGSGGGKNQVEYPGERGEANPVGAGK